MNIQNLMKKNGTGISPVPFFFEARVRRPGFNNTSLTNLSQADRIPRLSPHREMLPTLGE